MKRQFTIILTLLSAVCIHAQTFKPITVEEYLRPLMIYNQAYDEIISAIDGLSEYIIGILGQDIDTQMRNEMNVEYKAIQTLVKNLDSTGNIKMARYDYNRIKNNVRQKVVNYNNRVAQARQRAAEESAKQTQQPSDWSGSGFALNNGYICTNYHVVEGAKRIEILGVQGDFNTSYSAKVIATDKFNDLAILKISYQ